MLTLLQNVALGVVQATPIQVRTATAAVQYPHVKKDDVGKKDEADNAAKKATGRRFAPATRPTLVPLKPR